MINMNIQKFKRGSEVQITKQYKDPADAYLSYSGYNAIVEYTYGQEYGGNNYNSYSLIILCENIPINSVAWYNEDDIILISDDINKGLQIIEKYKYHS